MFAKSAIVVFGALRVRGSKFQNAEPRNVIQSKQVTANVMIRLHGCIIDLYPIW